MNKTAKVMGYTVTADGRIFASDGRERNQSTDKKGYKHVSVFDLKAKRYRNISVHRLVAIAFLPNPELKRCVNHLDGNKANNNVENLEWATHRENSHHSISVLGNKFWNRGEHHRSAKLKESQVHEIRKLRSIRTAKELAKTYNVTVGAIRQIFNRKIWKHI